jgi:hypothetical protein
MSSHAVGNSFRISARQARMCLPTFGSNLAMNDATWLATDFFVSFNCAFAGMVDFWMLNCDKKIYLRALKSQDARAKKCLQSAKIQSDFDIVADSHKYLIIR